MSTGEHVCAHCSDNFIVNSKVISCKLCSDFFHSQCLQIKDSVLKILKENNNLFWYCDTCVVVVNEKLDTAKLINKLEAKTQECINNSAELLKSFENSNEKTDKNDWVTVVKKKKKIPPLVITPKNAGQDSSKTKQAVTQKINPSNISIAVNKIKPSGHGSVIIECNDDKSLKKLQDIALTELSEEYNVELPKAGNPKIMIVGISENYLSEENDFAEKILRQCNTLSTEENEIKIVRKYLPKNKKLYNVVLEVSSSYFRDVMKTGKIFIGWESFPVYEYFGILRCFKCWRFGHKAAVCRQAHNICPMCSGNHKSTECVAQSHQCANCKYACEVLKVPNIDFKHTVFDKNCISYRNAQEKAKSRINYI